MLSLFKKYFLPLFLIICLCTAAGCSKNTVSPVSAPDYWPTNGWKTSTPEAQGMDSGTLNSMFEEISDTNLKVHSILIIKNGCLVTEGYLYPYNKNYRHLLNSCTKSITSSLVGLAIDEGYIKNTNQKIVDIFKDTQIDNQDEKKKKITIKNLLTMTAGLDWNETGAYGTPDDSNTQMQRSQNPVEYVLNQPMKEEPGKSFYYNTGASHVLSAIVQKATGKTSLDYAAEKIFKPLGISDVAWRIDKQGVYSGGSAMFMKPEDTAKFGYLYLNKGKWDNKQIISEKWVLESTKKQVDTPNGIAGTYGYGYQWWQNKFGGYSARGFEGQYLFVLPDYNMVVVFSSGLENNDFFKPEELVEKYIIPSIKKSSALDENEASFKELKNTLDSLNKCPSPKPVPSLPETALIISNKTFVMDDGETYSFEFKGENECKMHWFSDGMMYDLNIGLDDIYRENAMDQFYWKGMITKAGLKGHWINDNTFIVDLLPLEDSDSYTLKFTFNDTALNAKMIQVLNNAVVTDTNGTVK